MKSPAPYTERQMLKDLIVGLSLSTVIGVVLGLGLVLTVLGRAAITAEKLWGVLSVVAILWVGFFICLALIKLRLSRERQEAPTQAMEP